MKKAFNSLILVLLWILFSSAQSQEKWRTCVIVIDGDTILLDGNEIVRLIGIDTPKLRMTISEYPPHEKVS